MAENKTIRYYIDPLWDTVKKIREKVETILKDKPKDINDASKMTASELIENAVKYGCSIEDGTGIRFELEMDDETIRIVVKNKILSMDDYETVKDHIERIKSTDNPRELYLNRLLALMEDTRLKKTQLGLYRIAYEGEFSLSYEFENRILTVAAVRKI